MLIVLFDAQQYYREKVDILSRFGEDSGEKRRKKCGQGCCVLRAD
jgi:hypothetical protein